MLARKSRCLLIILIGFLIRKLLHLEEDHRDHSAVVCYREAAEVAGAFLFCLYLATPGDLWLLWAAALLVPPVPPVPPA